MKIYKMKYGFPYKKVFSGCALLCALAFAACTGEDKEDITAGNDITITVTIPEAQIPTTRSIAGGSGEAAVSSIHVLAFKPGGSGSPDVMTECVQGTIWSQNTVGSSGQYEVTFKAGLTLDNSVTSVVILANVPDAATLISGLTGKKAILEALTRKTTLTTEGDFKWNATSSYTPIPMYGEKTISGITLGMSIKDVSLTRMLARIDVVNNAASTFTLNQVLLVNYNTAGYIAPAWNTDGTMQGALPAAPMIPAASGKKTGLSLALEYNYAALNTGSGMLGEIYTYEAEANPGGIGHANATCLILDGRYNGKDYFYRVDFTTTGSSPTYMPLYRNHRYTVDITKVEGIGYESAGDALNALGIMNNLKTEIHMVEETGIININYNGQYYIGLGEEPALLWTAGATADVPCSTNYIGGWQVVKVEFASGDPEWLKAVKTTASTDKLGYVKLTTLLGSSSPKTNRTATVHLIAGRLTHTLRVTQKKKQAIWAGCNIYWDGCKLTFDDVNNHEHERYQGVFFKWGSLWGISPMGEISPYSLWIPPKTSIGAWKGNSTPVYKPSGSGYTKTKTAQWSNIPYFDAGTAQTRDPDKQYLTEVAHNSTNTAKGIGDICKFLTEQSGGTLHGKKWRMPTANEFRPVVDDEFSIESLTTANTDYVWVWPGTSPGTPNDSGTAIFPNGVRKSMGVGTPYFPVSGYRVYSTYMTYDVGVNGLYWSSSVYGENSGNHDIYEYSLFFHDTYVRPGAFHHPTGGGSVRCVVDQ